MFGWLSSTAVFASSTKRRTNASSTASSVRICLTTRRFSNPTAPRNVARKTRAMPPAAISRSSTYFPKICGNIGARYPSAFFCAVLNSAGCSEPSTPVTTVSVTAHELAGCKIPDRGPTDPSPFRLTLTALGPFPASRAGVARDPGLRASGHALSFNSATIGVDAVASNTAGASEGAFIGHSERRRDDRIDVSLWPEQTACEVVSADGGYPGSGAGQALGFSTRSGFSLVAGENAADQRAGSSLVFATDTGEGSLVPRERGTLRVSRAFATVTEFGDGLLVAGGTNPATMAAPEDAASTAEVFDPATGGFEPTLVELWSRRTHHAAVTLATTGETLLIGGLAPDPVSGTGPLIGQFEAVSPSTKSSSISDLSTLDYRRLDPIALVLT